MNRYDESTVYLTVTNKYPRSGGEPVPVAINITEPDSREWEDMDDALEFAAQLAAELPGVWAVWMRNGFSWRLIRDDGLQLRFYNRKMVECTVEVPEAYDGSNPWRSYIYLRDDDPQDVPRASANRNRGIKALARDFDNRVIRHADAVWAVALRHARFKADELAEKLRTVERLSAVFETGHREPDGITGYFTGEAGMFPYQVRFRVSYDSRVQLTVHVDDPDASVRVAQAIKEALWPTPHVEPPAQLGLFQNGEAMPLFMAMDA